MKDAPDDVTRMLDRMIADHERDRRQAAIDAARRDPRGHKLTRIFDGKSPSYRYYPAGRDGRGWIVRFCWSCNRNAAGYFLGWRELIPPKGSTAKHGGKRDQWIARKTRRRAEELALTRAERQAEKSGDERSAKDLAEWRRRLNAVKERAAASAKGRTIPASKPTNVAPIDHYR